MNTSDTHLPELQVNQGKPGESCVMVIFGATGNLTQRKLIPALYNLAKAKLLSNRFAVVGTSVEPMEGNAFRDLMVKAIEDYATDTVDPEVLGWFQSEFTISGRCP